MRLLVPEVGLEPTRETQRILSPPCLPFHALGLVVGMSEIEPETHRL